MELEYSTVKELKLFDSIVKEQPIEADIVLPEYFPPIGRILKCFVQPDEEAVTAAEGRISIAGTAAVRLLYSDDENRLHCYRTETKYTKVLQTEVRPEKMTVKVTQNIVSLNYKALGPKRVEIKSCAAVKADIMGIAETPIVSSAAGDVELLSSEREYSGAVCVCCRDIVGKENVRCDAGGKKLSSVLSSEVIPVVEKTEVITNKIMFKGKYDIKLVCAAEDGTVCSCAAAVPFTEVTDCYGIDESVECSAVFYGCEADVEKVNDSDDTVCASVRGKIFVYASKKDRVRLAEDAYALYADAECEYSSPMICGAPVILNEEAHVTAEAEFFEEGAFSVCAVFADNLTCSFTCRGNETAAEGCVCVNVLARGSDGQYFLASRNVPFERKLPDGMRCLECETAVHGICADISGNGKTGISAVIGFRVLAVSGGNVRALSGMKLGDRLRPRENERAVIYFAEKGERIWDIAKENRTTAANIKENNPVGDVLEADTRLIFTDF